MNYWLMKSEPAVYGIDRLAQEKATVWDGVRNYQARNFMKTMEVGDQAFFYHSNTSPPGIVGLMEITAALVVDPSQFEADGEYFDSKSTVETPRWHTVRVEYVQTFDRFLSLPELRDNFTAEELLVVKQGNRLSVMPVSDESAGRILVLAQLKNCE
jgi:predicted RNA-binding protein with PUA-like domain